MKGRVIKELSSRFTVDCDDKCVLASARGKLKRSGEIYVGDIVELELNSSDYVITTIYPRKNTLIRPYVSNIDIAFIVVAPIPKPDLYLVDKLIINCLIADIEPILVINKSDIAEQGLIDGIIADYKNAVEVIVVSATTGENIEQIKILGKNKISCLAGQSAVGKSSLLNAVIGNEHLKTGGLSKIDRGRHTTRCSEILSIGDAKFIDTCGFSMLEFELGFEPLKLSHFYDDFAIFADKCKFRGCSHTGEPDCAVRAAAERCEIGKERYKRYVELYKELNDKWRKRYD